MSDGFPARLVEARKFLGMSQRAIAEAVGCSKGSWEKYEAGKSRPGLDVLQGIASLGINLHWLATGDGAMRFSDSGPVDETLLREVVEAVEEILEERQLTLPPAKKALLFNDLYMMILKEEGLDDTTKNHLVMRMVRLAS